MNFPELNIADRTFAPFAPIARGEKTAVLPREIAVFETARIPEGANGGKMFCQKHWFFRGFARRICTLVLFFWRAIFCRAHLLQGEIAIFGKHLQSESPSAEDDGAIFPRNMHAGIRGFGPSSRSASQATRLKGKLASLPYGRGLATPHSPAPSPGPSPRRRGRREEHWRSQWHTTPCALPPAPFPVFHR